MASYIENGPILNLSPSSSAFEIEITFIGLINTSTPIRKLGDAVFLAVGYKVIFTIYL